MTKIILTGSEGLFGKVLQKTLSSENTDVVCIDQDLGYDLTDEQSVIDIMKAHSDAEYLVNLFAINHHIDKGKDNPDLFDISLDSLSKYCDVNLVALFSVCRSFVKFCNAKSIVNFSSLYGIRSPKKFLYDSGEKHIGYTITKHGVIGLSQHLATHMAPVRVNCLVPGGLETSGQSQEFKEAYCKNVPLGTMMKAEDSSGLIKLLCSEDSSYITGSVITIDGGWTSW